MYAKASGNSVKGLLGCCKGRLFNFEILPQHPVLGKERVNARSHETCEPSQVAQKDLCRDQSMRGPRSPNSAGAALCDSSQFYVSGAKLSAFLVHGTGARAYL